jgi:PAS domain S-box-containing protein
MNNTIPELQAALERAEAAIREKEEAVQSARAAALLLQKTFASLNEAVFIVQTGTRIVTDVNKAVETLFGYTWDEIVGRNTSCLHLDEEMSIRFGREMIAAYREKGFYETTYQMLRKDGTVFDSEHYVTPIHNSDGEITSHVCVVRDISERIRSEKQLKELNDNLERRISRTVEELRQKDDVLASQYKLLIDLAPEAIVVFDTELDRIVDANARAEQLFGYSREILLTSNPRQFYLQNQPDGRPPEASFFENSDRVIAGEALVIERAIRSTTGSEVICEVRLVRLPSPHSLLIRASFFDITERARTQNELTRALAGEHRLNEEQRQFMGLISHELRTPLSVIDGTAQLLVMTACKDKECLMHAERILSSTKRLTSLIDTCLTEERLCTSGWTPSMQNEDIRMLARSAVDQAQVATARHQISSSLDELPDRYTCDSMLIQVMLNNLLDNAIKYSPDGGSINVRGWRTEAGELFFEVADQGVGIAPDQIEKAFDRFYRVWQIPGVAGAGLGLHIVKRVAELHGGTVSCSSRPGLGSTFTVKLFSRDTS